jgi:hypothetical protein
MMAIKPTHHQRLCVMAFPPDGSQREPTSTAAMRQIVLDIMRSMMCVGEAFYHGTGGKDNQKHEQPSRRMAVFEMHSYGLDHGAGHLASMRPPKISDSTPAGLKPGGDLDILSAPFQK